MLFWLWHTNTAPRQQRLYAKPSRKLETPPPLYPGIVATLGSSSFLAIISLRSSSRRALLVRRTPSRYEMKAKPHPHFRTEQTPELGRKIIINYFLRRCSRSCRFIIIQLSKLKFTTLFP
jgi:hypothetical protein